MRKTILILLRVIYAVLIGCFIISIFGWKLIDKDYSYKEQVNHEYPLASIDNILVDDNYVYCFNQRFHGVNVYDKDGDFQFSIKVPHTTNGRGSMYFWEGYLCIKNDSAREVYQYQDGKYVYSVRYDYDESGENTDNSVNVFDENDQIIDTGTVEDEIVGYANGEIVSTDWEDEIFEINTSVTDAKGDVYSTGVLRPSLLKNQQAIRNGSIFKVLCVSPFLTVICMMLCKILCRIIGKDMKPERVAKRKNKTRGKNNE